MQITAKRGQTVIDVAIQVYGSADAAMLLARENNIDMMERFDKDTILQYSSTNIFNKSMVTHISDNDIVPVTSDNHGEFTLRTFDNIFDDTFF